MSLGKVIVFLVLLNLNVAFRILLVFPIPCKSHATLGEGYVNCLLDAGHEVTYITPIAMKNTNPRLRQIDVSSNYDIMPVDYLFDIKKIIDATYGFKDIYQNLYKSTAFTYGAIMHPNIQSLIHDTKEHFDVVIAEWLVSELHSGFSSVFNCPLIWSCSMEPHSLMLSLIDDVLNPAYNPNYLSSRVPPFNFFGRIQELWIMVKTEFYKWWLRDRDNAFFRNAFAASVEKRGRTLPSYFEVKYNASLMFGNSHVLTGSAIRFPQNFIQIGGYHIKEVIDPLPPNIQTILDNAHSGLIYFSLGSIAKSSSIPFEMKKALLDVFSKINQTILWKFEEKLQDLPKNVHIVSWAPQLGILAHSNCKLFITHGGLMSVLESIYFGVPIIGIPLFGDHHLNVNRAVDKGFGKRVDFDGYLSVRMEAAIVEILNDDRFYKKVKDYLLIYHDRVVPPGKLIAHWVSHVIRTNGARHLRSPAFLVPWYKKIYLDLIVIIILSYILLRASFQALNRFILIRHKLYRVKLKV